MRAVPAGLQAHLDSATTTLCTCWRITRRDGVRLGFTDHDRNIVFDGTTYEAASGLSGTETRASVGLSVDNMEVDGVVTSDRLAAADLEAGLYDAAEVEITLVNWQDPDQRLLLRSGALGEVKRGRTAFTAEVRGLAHLLQQEQGRLYQFGCDAVLGDGRCGVNLNTSQFKGAGTVVAVLSPTRLTASGLTTFAPGWFTRGLLTWSGGANSGRSIEVRRHDRSGGVVTIDLWQPMAHALAAADTFTITAGCDRMFATCKAKFANSVNYRGFPHMPGNDFLTSYPNRDDANKNGGALVK